MLVLKEENVVLLVLENTPSIAFLKSVEEKNSDFNVKLHWKQNPH